MSPNYQPSNNRSWPSRPGGQPNRGGQPAHERGQGGAPAAPVDVSRLKFARADIVPTLFSDEAEKLAKQVGESGKNKSAQLRNFYNELVMWEERCEGNPAKLQENLPYIYMMKAKAAYAKGRDNIDDNFLKLFTGIINGIKDGDIDTLKNAKLFFEAFMGYYKIHNVKNV